MQNSWGVYLTTLTNRIPAVRCVFDGKADHIDRAVQGFDTLQGDR